MRSWPWAGPNAFQLVHDEAWLKIDDSKDLVRSYYTLAMLHCRFLPNAIWPERRNTS